MLWVGFQVVSCGEASAEKTILTSRLIDRPFVPCFPNGCGMTCVIATTLSLDEQVPPDVLAVTGASIAAACQDSFNGPMAAGASWFGDDYYQSHLCRD